MPKPQNRAAAHPMDERDHLLERAGGLIWQYPRTALALAAIVWLFLTFRRCRTKSRTVTLEQVWLHRPRHAHTASAAVWDYGWVPHRKAHAAVGATSKRIV